MVIKSLYLKARIAWESLDFTQAQALILSAKKRILKIQELEKSENLK